MVVFSYNSVLKFIYLHFQKITNSQKKSISKYSRRLCDLRTLVTNLMNALDVDTDTNISTIKEKIDILTECYANISIQLDQFSVLLKSCPEKELTAEFEAEFDSVLSNSPITRCYKNSDEWRELYSKVKSMITIVNKQRTALLKLINSMPKQIGQGIAEAPVVSQSHIDVTNDAKANLEKIQDVTDKILDDYKFKLKYTIVRDFEPRHPILRCMANLSKYVNETIIQFEKVEEPIDIVMVEDTNNQIIDQTEDLIATMLLIVQSIYKKHLPQEKSTDNTDVLNAIDEIIDEEKEKEESKEILEDKHLKELLQEKLSSDSKMLQLDLVINKLRTILINYVQYIAVNTNVDEVKNVLMRLVPILEQTVLFVQYFVTQKVAVHRVSCKMLSVLLKIFSDLATKG